MATFKNNQVGHPDMNEALRTSPQRADFRGTDQELQRADRIGLIAAIIVMAFGTVLLALWADSRSTFEKCAALTDVNARAVCYEEVGRQKSKPPAKGAVSPIAPARSEDQ